jgi:hypothetical protein
MTDRHTDQTLADLGASLRSAVEAHKVAEAEFQRTALKSDSRAVARADAAVVDAGRRYLDAALLADRVATIEGLSVELALGARAKW